MHDSGDEQPSFFSSVILENAMVISAWLGGLSLALLLVGGILVLARNGRFEPSVRRSTHRDDQPLEQVEA